MGGPIAIRPVQPPDSAAWERMRQALWPSESGEHAQEIARFFNGARSNRAEVLLACARSGAVIGFVELSIRPYAEGCSSSRVAYVEGWYVEPQERGRGAGTALVRAAEEWARAQGCTELASDADIGNDASAAAHQALGFAEVVRITCFRKDL